ncbi:MAG: tetratricopeptide repeat protein, partial [Anaerolineales bacterium]|nr:tetratricopeptide repeat protein [Anaerolineales bacterium]
THVEAQLRDWLGTLYFFSGEHDAATQQFRDALRLAKLVGDSHTLGSASFHLAQALHMQGEITETIPLLEHAHQHFTQADDARGLIGTMNMLGQLFRQRGDIDEARRWYQGGIELGRARHDYYGLLVILNNMGVLLHELGDFAGSLALFDESEELLQKLGTAQDGLVMLNFGRNYEALGDIDKAAAFYEGAIPVFEAQHARHHALVARSWASRAARLRGDLTQAQQWIDEALRGFRQNNTLFSIADSLANLGDIGLARAELDGAEKAYDESLQLVRQLGQPGGELRCAAALARIATMRGDSTKAQEWLETAVSILPKTHQLIIQYQLLASLAMFFAANGNAAHGMALLNWIQQQPTAMWETRQFAQNEAAALHDQVENVATISPDRSLTELLTFNFS